MQDVQFNAMALAASDRALARRRAEALAEAGDFETTLGAVTPPAAAALEAPAAEAAIPVVTAPAAADLTGAQMDTLMANFGKADAVPPAAIAAAAPPAKSGDQTDTAAVAALKSAPAAANLTPEQMTALLSGFGRQAGTVDPAPVQASASEPAEVDTMSATKFFPIQRKAGAASSLYASDAGPAPADGRYFPIKPAASPVASLYATPPEPSPPADPTSAPAPAATDTAATAQYYPVDGDRPLPGAAATARDAYLRAMDVNARVLGLASHR